MVRRCAAILFCLLCLSAAANAQNALPVLPTGDAAVAGFSGTVVLGPPPPPEPQRIDKTYIDLDGPSLRVIGLARMGGPPQAPARAGTQALHRDSAPDRPGVFARARRRQPAQHLRRGQLGLWSADRCAGCRWRWRARSFAPRRAERGLHARPVWPDHGRRRTGFDLEDQRQHRRGDLVRQCHARRRAEFRTGARRRSHSIPHRVSSSSPTATPA